MTGISRNRSGGKPYVATTTHVESAGGRMTAGMPRILGSSSFIMLFIMYRAAATSWTISSPTATYVMMKFIDWTKTIGICKVCHEVGDG